MGIAHGIARFEPGAGGDYKYLRGFEARPTYSMHFLAEPRLAAAVARFLEQERAHAASVIEQLGASSPLKHGVTGVRRSASRDVARAGTRPPLR